MWKFKSEMDWVSKGEDGACERERYEADVLSSSAAFAAMAVGIMYEGSLFPAKPICK